MVSYYNTLSYTQKHSAANLAYPGSQPWQWTANYHAPPNPQFLSEMEPPHAAHHQVYYNHHHMFHAGAAGSAPTDWHSPSHSENFSQSVSSAHQMLQQHHALNGVGSGTSNSSASSGNSSAAAASVSGPGNTNLNESAGSGEAPIAECLPSPPITVSGSEISSPGVPASSSPHPLAHHLASSNNNNNSPSTNNNNNNNNNGISNSSINTRTSPGKTQYYDWMKKPSYPTQPAPGTYVEAEQLCTTSHLEDFPELLDSTGKTRTKDKYRVVYTDFQRLELEKEYCTSRYITIRRKTELAQSLSLSERQVKIWFQNRRAKERKQNKKTTDPVGPMGGGMQHNDYVNLMDSKPKLEPGLHLQHSLHSMSSMAMGMPPMSLHHHLHTHPLAAVSAAAVVHSHPLHHSHQSQMSQMSAAAAASVGSLAM